MELSAGCEIKTHRINMYGQHQFNRGKLKLNLVSFEVWSEHSKKELPPITLPNVLEWLHKLDERGIYSISCEGSIFDLCCTIIGQWDLSKNLLREQSTELIDSLFNLIEKG
jgi:hypothetical protein